MISKSGRVTGIDRRTIAATLLAVSTPFPVVAGTAYGANNQGVEIRPAPSRWDITVRDLGAIGDGLADDWAPIQKSLDENVITILPPGKYRISRSLRIRRSGMSLLGSGSAVSEVLWPGQTDHLIQISPSDTDIVDVNISDLGVYGDPTVDGDFFGILGNWKKQQAFLVRDIKILRCKVSNTPSAGIVVREADGLTVRDCQLMDTGRDGIQVTGTSNAIIESNYVTGSGDDAIAFHSGYTGRHTSGRISGNLVEEIRAAKAISLGGSRDVVVIANIVRGFYNRGIDVYYDYNFNDASESPARIIISTNMVINSAAASSEVDGGTAAVMIAGFYDPKSGDLAAAPYERRQMGRHSRFPPANINISGNYLGTGEARSRSGSGAPGDTLSLAYGIRLYSCAEEISITGNQIYNCEKAVYVDAPRLGRGGIPVSDLIVQGNRFRRYQSALTVSGDVPLPGGISVVGNSFREPLNNNAAIRLPAGTRVETAGNLWPGDEPLVANEGVDTKGRNK